MKMAMNRKENRESQQGMGIAIHCEIIYHGGHET